MGRIDVFFQNYFSLPYLKTTAMLAARLAPRFFELNINITMLTVTTANDYILCRYNFDCFHHLSFSQWHANMC